MSRWIMFILLSTILFITGILALTNLPQRPSPQTPLLAERTTTMILFSTATSTSYRETLSPSLVVWDEGGEFPSDITRVSFDRIGEALRVSVEVKDARGFAYPYAYAVFLSDNPVKGRYCLLFKPWPEREAEILLVTLEDYSTRSLAPTIKGRRVDVIAPLEMLPGLLSTPGGGFYAWTYSWAYAFVPLERIEETENIYMFDTVPVERISFTPIPHREPFLVEEEVTWTTTSILLTSYTPSPKNILLGGYAGVIFATLLWLGAAVLLERGLREKKTRK